MKLRLAMDVSIYGLRPMRCQLHLPLLGERILTVLVAQKVTVSIAVAEKLFWPRMLY